MKLDWTIESRVENSRIEDREPRTCGRQTADREARRTASFVLDLDLAGLGAGLTRLLALGRRVVAVNRTCGEVEKGGERMQIDASCRNKRDWRERAGDDSGQRTVEGG